MGKLAQLLGTGIGLVAEVSKDSFGSQKSNNTQDYRPRNQSNQGFMTPQRQSSYSSYQDDQQYSFEEPSRLSNEGNRDLSYEVRPSSSTYQERNFDCQQPTYNDQKRANNHFVEEEVLEAPPSYDDSEQRRPRSTFQYSTRQSNGHEPHSDQGPYGEYQSPSYYDLDSRMRPQSVGRSISRGSTQQSMSPGPLSLPVIVPQRRPEDKSRGWRICYAPALDTAGITERDFHAFLQSFNTASKNTYLDVINIAGAGVGFAPGITPMVISMVTPIAVHAAKKQQTNIQTKSFLTQANEAYFMPRGLFVIIMTYDPQNTNQVIGVGMRGQGPSSSRQQQDYSQAYDSTSQQQPFQLPQSADLIYPDSTLNTASSSEPPKTGFARAGHVAADYLDRRAQAQSAAKNPNSDFSAMGPKPTFNSPWGDPNSAAYSGGLKTLITGGMVGGNNNNGGGGGGGEGRRSDKQDRKAAKRARKNGGDGYDGQQQHQQGEQQGSGKGPGLIKGLKGMAMQKDLLYLMIVNLPADAT